MLSLYRSTSENSTVLEESNTHYHVSSRHLMLASPWFQAALAKEGWNESRRNEADGRFHIMAEDWDAEAFLAVLRIIHLRNKKVPRNVTLEMLAKIAVIVDYYHCEEAIEMFSAMWIDNHLRVALPSTYCRDLVLWISISYVFGLKERFEKATAIAMRQSTGSVRTLGLPIPGKVSGMSLRQDCEVKSHINHRRNGLKSVPGL